MLRHPLGPFFTRDLQALNHTWPNSKVGYRLDGGQTADPEADFSWPSEIEQDLVPTSNFDRVALPDACRSRADPGWRAQRFGKSPLDEEPSLNERWKDVRALL
jgi:hypothetical protein